MGDTVQGTERRVFVGGMPFSYEVSCPWLHVPSSVSHIFVYSSVALLTRKLRVGVH